MGFMTKGWVWMTINNLGPVFRDAYTLPEVTEYDGLMFINGLWNCKCNTQKSAC